MQSSLRSVILSKSFCKMINGLNQNLVSFINFHKNNSNVAINRHASDNPAPKHELIDLSDSPVLDSKLFHLDQAGKGSVRPLLILPLIFSRPSLFQQRQDQKDCHNVLSLTIRNSWPSQANILTSLE